MLPQEIFAFEYLYKGWFLCQMPWDTQKDIEKLMSDCGLRYRKGKNINDLREAFWGSGPTKNLKNWNVFAEICLERADKIWVIDWVKIYGRKRLYA